MTHRYCTHCSTLMQANATCPRCSRPHGDALTIEHHSPRWRKLSRLALRTHPRCARCPSTTRLTAHHLRYPAHTLDDVEVLCRSCHATETATPPPH